MARTNRRGTTYAAPAKPAVTTYEGAPARILDAKPQLRRAVLSCLLWEKQFYESGEDIATRIERLVSTILLEEDGQKFVEDLAIEVRTEHGLRHAPLWMANALSNQHKLRAALVSQIVQRADEMTELLAMYWKNGKKPISNPLKKGLAEAFTKFDRFQLSRYKAVGNSPITLRDVMFLTHPTAGRKGYTTKARGPKAEKVIPADLSEQEIDWLKLADETIEPPDTWEVELSAGKDKKETFTRLLSEKKLGALATLRNLRNMHQAGVEESLIFERLAWIDQRARILPYQFITAARMAPQWETQIESAMMRNLEGTEKLTGRTLLLIDVSFSMKDKLSEKGDMTRMDAACGLAVLAREMCEKVAIFAFSNECKLVPDRYGFALRDAIVNSMPHGGTNLGAALKYIAKQPGADQADRIIVFTDEQSSDVVGKPFTKAGYVINVAGYKYEVAYKDWVRVSGFSEATLKFVHALEVEAK